MTFEWSDLKYPGSLLGRLFDRIIKDPPPPGSDKPLSDRLIAKAIVEKVPEAPMQWLVGTVAWHNAEKENSIEKTKREVKNGSWSFTSSDLCNSADFWTIERAVPVQIECGNKLEVSILLEMLNPYEPMLEAQMIKTYFRNELPPKEVYASLKEFNLGDFGYGTEKVSG